MVKYLFMRDHVYINEMVKYLFRRDYSVYKRNGQHILISKLDK